MKRWLARTTVFAAFFAITSFLLSLKGLLTGNYVAMCSAVQTMMVGRAIADDYHERNKDSKDSADTSTT
jgi:hypothetical protein